MLLSAPQPNVIEALAALGFTTAKVLSETDSAVTVRIRTSRGWTYERFSNDATDAVSIWARNHKPEAS